MSNERPNIFDFGTSELTQDAFICWLVSWVNCSEDTSLQKCAKDLVARFYSAYQHRDEEWDAGSGHVPPGHVSSVRELKQQHLKTDVHFVAVISDQAVRFIIEDKTYTSHHSGQLKRYKESIAKQEEIKQDDIASIYFKTGYVTPWDEKAENEGYRIVDYRAIHSFLEDHSDILHPIFQDYREYIRRCFYERYTDGLRLFFEQGKVNVGPADYAFAKENDTQLLGYDFIQIELMKCLRDACRTSIHKDIRDPIEVVADLNGRTHTNLWFWEQGHVRHYPEGRQKEWLGYQAGQRQQSRGGVSVSYVSLRQYAEVRQNEEAEQEKTRRRGLLRGLFENARRRACGDSDQSSLTFSDPINRGVNESEIAVLFLDESHNTPGRILGGWLSP